jgi:hypothetical protein
MKWYPAADDILFDILSHKSISVLFYEKGDIKKTHIKIKPCKEIQNTTFACYVEGRDKDALQTRYP